MKRLIIVGSPRTSGRSAHLAEMLFEANIDERPEDELFLVPVSEVDVGPCIGCNGCREKSGVIVKDDDGKEATVQRYRCVFDDDMQMLYDLIDDADQITVVSPVYFSGAPAPLKCLLDRLQPYYWAGVDAAEGHRAAKRPAELHVLGDGGDPHGYDALVSEVRSALAVAGFRLERILDWIGKLTETGEITAEPKETPNANSETPTTSKTSDADGETATSGTIPVGARSCAPSNQGNPPTSAKTSDAGDEIAANGKTPVGARSCALSNQGNPPTQKQRPKLNLSSGQKKPTSAAKTASTNKRKPANKGKRRGK